MTREELLGLEGATETPYGTVRINLHRVMNSDASLLIRPDTGDVIIDEGDDDSDCVYLGRAATVADVELLIGALRGLGR